MTLAGFNSAIALKELTPDCIEEIEKLVQINRHLFPGTTYENIDNCKLLPGHRLVILSLAKHVNESSVKSTENTNQPLNLSVILQKLLETVQLNDNKQPKQFRYCEVIRYFSTYVYLMCGRACYETLSNNLPIPKACTICEYKYTSAFNHPRIVKTSTIYSELHRRK